VLVFASLAAGGAGIHIAIDALTGHGQHRTAALAVALPLAGYLLGLATIMTITGTPLWSRYVLPKLAGAAVVIVLALVAPVTATVIGCAMVIVFLATSMVVTDPRPPAGRGPTFAGVETDLAGPRDTTTDATLG
jgi:hypothetical protein